MIGEAKLGHYATKKDFNNLRKREPEAAKARLRSLKENRFSWFEVGPLAEGEPGREDDKHQVIETAGEKGVVRIQQELREDPNSQFFRLGFTVAEANDFLAG
jgi:hypothetical protein